MTIDELIKELKKAKKSLSEEDLKRDVVIEVYDGLTCEHMLTNIFNVGCAYANRAETIREPVIKVGD